MLTLVPAPTYFVKFIVVLDVFSTSASARDEHLLAKEHDPDTAEANSKDE
jgi:hypothetical protein